MAHQGELFPEPKFIVTPDASRSEPRLWVQRLVIWEKPGEVLREVRLRKGLNIIWSPDPGSDHAVVGEESGSGHGAGKTLFCRMLRYCLGEDTFARSDLRRSIAERFPDGLVGAEVVIAGKQWAVIRPIGRTRKQIAKEGVALEGISSMKEPGSDLHLFFDAIEKALFKEGIQKPLSITEHHASWLFALAWLSRDSECRFDHILDWRDRRSESGSIALRQTQEPILTATRIFLGMLQPEELDVQLQRSGVSEDKRSTERDLSYQQQRSKRLLSELQQALNLELDELTAEGLGISLLRTKAEERLQLVDSADAPEDVEALRAFRNQREDVGKEVAVLESDIERFRATREVHEQQLKAIRGERANLDANALKTLLGPVCPVCFVPIDQALAEGCGLSHSAWDPNALQDEKRRLSEQTDSCNKAIARIDHLIRDQRNRRDALGLQRGELTKKIDELEKRTEEARVKRRQAWFAAKQLLSKVNEHKDTLDAIEEARRAQEKLITLDAALAGREAQLRAGHSERLTRLRALFSYVCKGLLGKNVVATLDLTGQGIQAGVEVGGMAMESLKVIAFDLAAILMSIEGRTEIPSFLIHDSPREADLGESIYHRLFRMVHSLEDLGSEPPFQYLVTTTTEPPAELCVEPFLVAQLHGAHAEHRLLRRNLPS